MNHTPSNNLIVVFYLKRLIKYGPTCKLTLCDIIIENVGIIFTHLAFGQVS
jgi:hypothetical protein